MDPIIIAFGMDKSLIPEIKLLFPDLQYEVLPLDDVLNSKQLRERCEVLWVGLTPYVDRNLLERFPNLKIVASSTTGHTHLDLHLIEGRNISLVTLAGEFEFLSGITATPELAWGLVLDVWRKISLSQQSAEISAINREIYASTQLKNRKLGIIGLGRVGKRIAKYAEAFELDICAFDKSEAAFFPGVEMVSLYSLLTTSDIVVISASVHLEDLASYPILGAQEIKLMKKSSIVINIARGVLVDEYALAKAINKGDLLGVGSDVQQNEEISKQGETRSPLNESRLSGKNVVLTPHIGGMCSDALDQCNEFIAKKIRAVSHENSRFR